ncbi:MAG: hypothetical protein M8354_14070, partial [Halalkalicoccus sp.]|nr:hypothetical protein [Halalkalicoccus sp.]
RACDATHDSVVRDPLPVIDAVGATAVAIALLSNLYTTGSIRSSRYSLSASSLSKRSFEREAMRPRV